MKVNEFRRQTRDRYNSWPSTRRVTKKNFTASVQIQKSQSHEDVFGRRTNTNTEAHIYLTFSTAIAFSNCPIPQKVK